MTNETNSIFDKEFLQETVIRRRALMPLALKIYMWFFLSASMLLVLRGAYGWFTGDAFGDFRALSYMDLFNVIVTFLTPLLRFFPNLFLLMEKKWAVLVALVAAGILMALSCYNTIAIYSITASTLYVVLNVCWLLIEVPYVVMLSRIKNKWETIAVAKAA